MKKNGGYVICESVLFDNNRGLALGRHENSKVPAPFVTWQFTEENGQRDYYWGHYHADEAAAKEDFKTRADDYQRMYKVQEVKQCPIAEQMKEAALQAAMQKRSVRKTDKGREDR